MVPKAKHRVPLTSQPRIPDRILIFRIGMLSTIDLNNYFLFETDEIKNVSSDRLLSSEFHPIKLLASEMFP